MAKTSILTVMIQLAKAGNGDRETIKGLSQIKQNVGLAMGAFTALAGVGYTLNKVYQGTTKVFVDYAAQVRDVQRITGMGAEQTSRLIQAADDLGISFESLSKSMWAASKQGIDTSIESLASMADEYVALGSAAEQAEFLAKKFGKSGAEMGKLMEKGGEGVRAYTDAIQGALVLTDEAVRAAREHEMAVDELGDTWQALKVSVGQFTVGPLTKGLQSLNEQIKEEGIIGIGTADILQILWASFKKGEDTTDSATRSYMAWAEAVGNGTSNMEDAAKAAEELASKQEMVLDVAFQLQSATDSYDEKLEDLTEKQKAAQGAWDTANQQYNQGKIGVDELNAANITYQNTMQETGSGINKLAAEHEMAMNRIVFSILQSQAAAEGLSASESKALLQIAVKLKLLDQNTADLATDMVNNFGDVSDGVRDSVGAVVKLNEEIWVAGTQQGTYNYKFIIKTVGNVPYFGGLGAEESAQRTGRGGTLIGYAEGGQLGRGWALVGDKPGGGVTPYSELVSPTGRVYDHETSMSLLNSGLMPEFSMAFGGDADLQSSGSISTKKRVKPGAGHANIPTNLSGVITGTTSDTQETGAVSTEVQAALTTTSNASMQMSAAFDRTATTQTQAMTEMTQSNQDLLQAVTELGNKIETLQDKTVRATREALQQVLT